MYSVSILSFFLNHFPYIPIFTFFIHDQQVSVNIHVCLNTVLVSVQCTCMYSRFRPSSQEDKEVIFQIRCSSIYLVNKRMTMYWYQKCVKPCRTTPPHCVYIQIYVYKYNQCKIICLLCLELIQVPLWWIISVQACVCNLYGRKLGLHRALSTSNMNDVKLP